MNAVEYIKAVHEANQNALPDLGQLVLVACIDKVRLMRYSGTSFDGAHGEQLTGAVHWCTHEQEEDFLETGRYQ